MAKSTPAEDRVIAKVAEVFGKETAVRLNAELEARNLIANKIADAKRATDSAIEEALRTGAVLRHIHLLGLGTKNSKRVYEVKNAMDWTPQEPALESVKVKHYGWNEEPEVAWFETSTGMIERVQIPMDYQNEPLVAQTEEESALIAANRDLFVEALTKFYGN